MQAGLADGRARRSRVHVDDVRPHRDVHGHGDGKTVGVPQKARLFVRRILLVEEHADGFTETEPVLDTLPGRNV